MSTSNSEVNHTEYIADRRILSQNEKYKKAFSVAKKLATVVSESPMREFHQRLSLMSDLLAALEDDAMVKVVTAPDGTLKEETFAGRNFRGFAVFSQIRESLFSRNFSKDVIRESLFQRNFLKKSSSANILKKIRFFCYDMVVYTCGTHEKVSYLLEFPAKNVFRV